MKAAFISTWKLLHMILNFPQFQSSIIAISWSLAMTAKAPSNTMNTSSMIAAVDMVAFSQSTHASLIESL